jgi:hypothetical protein
MFNRSLGEIVRGTTRAVFGFVAHEANTALVVADARNARRESDCPFTALLP